MYRAVMVLLFGLSGLGFFGTQIYAVQAAEFELRDGDRVVLLGGTLIEREQNYGYWETMLTARNAEKNIVFRNLGWSGDTVFADARGGFGTPADGFREMQELVEALKPTVIFANYGANEAFEGAAGLSRFRNGLDALLDMLDATKARICLISPPPHEKLGPPLPDPESYNRGLAAYRDALREAAERRSYGFVDLFTLFGELNLQPGEHLTDNGVHLTAYGYWRTAEALAKGLGLPVQPAETEFSIKDATSANPLRFQRGNLMAPPPAAVASAPRPAAARTITVQGLEQGVYKLMIDGKLAASASAEQWAKGVAIRSAPDDEQAEQLRQAILRKNELYFHRWRPQNVTYLLGFRKHEQGQNAKEIVQFDPLIAAEEELIRKLKTPATHACEFIKNN